MFWMDAYMENKLNEDIPELQLTMWTMVTFDDWTVWEVVDDITVTCDNKYHIVDREEWWAMFITMHNTMPEWLAWMERNVEFETKKYITNIS
jgi:hypothetical protein